MAAELPNWTDYTATVTDEHARYLDVVATALGLRVGNLGNGDVALDAEAFRLFASQPEDATVSVEAASELSAGERHMIWIQGTSYPLEPSFSTGISAERNREADEALAQLEEGATYDARPLMPNQHKTRLLGWHPSSAEDAAWVRAEAERQGVDLKAVLDEMLREYRERRSGDQPESGDLIS